MSSHQNPAKVGSSFVTTPDLNAQNDWNRAICAQWQQDRLIEARGILADVAHHPDSLVVLACRVVCTHGSDPIELADALGVSRLLSRNRSQHFSNALNGGAA